MEPGLGLFKVDFQYNLRPFFFGGGGGGGCELRLNSIDFVPQALQVACHHGDAQTNKPTKYDGRVGPLISPLHNADKASGVPAIG